MEVTYGIEKKIGEDPPFYQVAGLLAKLAVPVYGDKLLWEINYDNLKEPGIDGMDVAEASIGFFGLKYLSYTLLASELVSRFF